MKHFLKYLWLPLVILTIWNLIIGYYPDYLWFDSFGYSSIWIKTLQLRFYTFVVFFFISFTWFFCQAKLARHLSKNSRPFALKFKTPFPNINQILDLFNEISVNKSGVSIWIFSLISALFMAILAHSNWPLFGLFFHQTPYGLTDPIWRQDISFYFFSLPVLSYIQHWMLELFVISFFNSLWIYLKRGSVQSFFGSYPVLNKAKIHLFTLLSLILATLSMGVWVKPFELLYSKRGVVFGAGYTDIHSQIVAYQVTALLLAIYALMIFIFGFKKDYKKLIGTGIFIAIVSVFLNVLYPFFVQTYLVSPNEIQKEKKYLADNIKYTRYAYQLDQVVVEEFSASSDLTLSDIQQNSNIINNIRLWNEEPLKETFSQLQEIRPYYAFNNIDVDRYPSDSGLQQVLLSPREMNTDQLPEKAQTWMNKHLVYTHGYGVCLSPVNQISPEGLPLFYIENIPPVFSHGFKLENPQIYFGENQPDYSLVNTQQAEFDYPKGNANVYTKYTGNGGIQLDSALKRIIFSLKLSDVNLGISTLITEKSRILFDRNISTIVKKIFPYVVYDKDPYIVVTPKTLIWILDGYTLSSRFPYSEPFNGKSNYIRNAVKVTIDAYSGKTTFYMTDSKDPIIRGYASLYPGVFLPFESMPSILKEHIRYPKTIFSIQSKMYSTYHMTDPQVFYNREDIWDSPKRKIEGAPEVSEPYYMVTKIPGELAESFVLMQPFTPAGKNNLIAWMGAKCEKNEYGKLKVFGFSKEKTIYGPQQIESRIDQDTDISQKLTLWGQVGSRVIRGDLLVIPIQGSVIYVQPVYLQATNGKLPELKRVIFAYKDEIVMAQDLSTAIKAIFENKPIQEPDLLKMTKQSNNKNDTNKNVLNQVKKLFNRLKSSAQNGHFQEFGRILEEINSLIGKEN